MPNRLCLNYHDAVLYSADVEILRSKTSWLNDSLIYYQMMRYQHELHKVEGRRFLFMDPSIVSYLMHQCFSTDELLEFYHGQGILEGYQSQYNNRTASSHKSFHPIQVLFLPINDSNALSDDMPGCASAVGTHWSLLMVIVLLVTRQDDHEEDLLQPIYLHYDSVGNSINYSAAVAVAKKIHLLLRLETTPNKYSYSTMSKHEPDFSGIADICIRNCKTPQQSNAWDCGIHVLAAADILATALDNFGLWRNDHMNRLDQLFSRKSNDKQRSCNALNVETLAFALEEILQSSNMVTHQQSFASDIREEICNSVVAGMMKISGTGVKETPHQD